MEPRNEVAVRIFNTCGQPVRIRLAVVGVDVEGRVEYSVRVGRSWTGTVKSGPRPDVTANERHLLRAMAATALAKHDAERGECAYPKRSVPLAPAPASSEPC